MVGVAETLIGDFDRFGVILRFICSVFAIANSDWEVARIFDMHPVEMMIPTKKPTINTFRRTGIIAASLYLQVGMLGRGAVDRVFWLVKTRPETQVCVWIRFTNPLYGLIVKSARTSQYA
jgi:hypothetical protein